MQKKYRDIGLHFCLKWSKSPKIGFITSTRVVTSVTKTPDVYIHIGLNRTMA
jgi:hypothetical protein